MPTTVTTAAVAPGTVAPVAKRMLDQEARGLLTRLALVKSFALYETMVPAASLSTAAQAALERHLVAGRRSLRAKVRAFLKWLRGPEGRLASPDLVQRRFTLLRLLFNVALTQFDLFSQVVTQRSEHETGVWLAGLDIVADDALKVPGLAIELPPLMCYLDRGPGAAIRRARTRLPGGGLNPVGIIRVPRERMVGSGIASSLVHEVGHQAAALLGLVESLREAIRRAQRGGSLDPVAWVFWDRWISEIVADFWSVAKVGIASTLGLIAVVSLPRTFVFRLNVDDPHPIPWVRVKLSCAIGRALFPHPQWDGLAALWESLYPTEGLDPTTRQTVARLEANIPAFVRLMVGHRPPSLGGRSLAEALRVGERQPARLAALYRAYAASDERLRDAPPTLVFAVIGQARADGRIGPEQESRYLTNLLTYWAFRSNVDASESCAARQRAAVPAQTS